MARNTLAAMLMAAGIALGAAPAAAEGGAPEAAADEPIPQRGVTLRSGGALSAFRAVSNSDIFENRSTAYFYITDMELVVRAERDSRMVITLSAECRATPDTPGEPLTAFVMILVNARTMPSMRNGGRVAFCSSGNTGWESHSFQWVSAPVNRRVNTITVGLARSFGPTGTVALGDRVLTVHYEPL